MKLKDAMELLKDVYNGEADFPAIKRMLEKYVEENEDETNFVRDAVIDFKELSEINSDSSRVKTRFNQETEQLHYANAFSLARRMDLTDDDFMVLYEEFYGDKCPYMALHRDTLLVWLDQMEADGELIDQWEYLKSTVETYDHIQYWLVYQGG